ncbi:lipocalin family protein [Rugamonas apoptosis]|uniref:Lipocalin family protein n=1 Tax=Rugamonas apoptosis TaxID=2758570 RepID=A0A7W2FED7_9BURK|nr:lipocalin family protein [Rugamonas apoptosis]MBA5690202.1 lipocalin family protein [Rugamonas apoptosis]
MLDKTAAALMLAASLMLAPACSAAAPATDDAALGAQLVGTWINPPDSPDYERIPSRETFLADGTYTYFEYKDMACRRLAERITVRWTIRDGILTSILSDGAILKDKIISLTPEKIVLRSLDDGRSYFRIRSTACPTALKGTHTASH